MGNGEGNLQHVTVFLGVWHPSADLGKYILRGNKHTHVSQDDVLQNHQTRLITGQRSAGTGSYLQLEGDLYAMPQAIVRRRGSRQQQNIDLVPHYFSSKLHSRSCVQSLFILLSERRVIR